jgi:mRNA interferase RelE/StbE
MTWQIELSEEAENFLDKLYKGDKKGVAQIHKKLLMISQSPKQFGKSLKGDRSGIWRYRFGDYRILCQLKDEVMLILVLEIGNRKDIYDNV